MPDTPVAPPSGESYDPSIPIRVSRLEDEMREAKAARTPVEAAIIRIEAILPHLATKADVAAMRADIARVEAKADLAAEKAELAAQKADLAAHKTEGLAADVTELRVALTDKPGKLYMWGILTALLTAYACGLAALAILK